MNHINIHLPKHFFSHMGHFSCTALPLTNNSLFEHPRHLVNSEAQAIPHAWHWIAQYLHPHCLAPCTTKQGKHLRKVLQTCVSILNPHHIILVWHVTASWFQLVLLMSARLFVNVPYSLHAKSPGNWRSTARNNYTPIPLLIPVRWGFT